MNAYNNNNNNNKNLMGPENHSKSPSSESDTMPKKPYYINIAGHGCVTDDDKELVELLHAARDGRNHQYLYCASEIRKFDEEIAGERAKLVSLQEHMKSRVDALDNETIGLQDISKDVTAYDHISHYIQNLQKMRSTYVDEIQKFQELDETIKGIVANMPTYRGPSLENKNDNLSELRPSEPTGAESPPPGMSIPHYSCTCDACNIDQHVAEWYYLERFEFKQRSNKENGLSK